MYRGKNGVYRVLFQASTGGGVVMDRTPWGTGGTAVYTFLEGQAFPKALDSVDLDHTEAAYQQMCLLRFGSQTH